MTAGLYIGSKRKLLGGLLLGALAMGAGSAHANPSGESVAYGSALFERNGNQLSITTSDKVIINWGDFSISAGELTQFLQPGANSLALNRVMTGIPSNISGILQANGGIILVNPAGIMVGPGGMINVGSFIGSTLDIPDANFIAGGDLHFSGNSQASIVNMGTVNAASGDVFLLARQIENHGVISAPLGTVGLGAGHEIILRPAGAERRLEVLPKADGNSGVGILNTGTIHGATAELMTNGGNAYSMAIHNTGTIQATGVAESGGRIYLTGPNNKVVNEGTLKATRGANGGEIHIEGLEVITTPTSKIDASGTAEGAGGLVTISGAPAVIVDGKVVTGPAAQSANGQTQTANGGGKVLINGEIVATGLTGGEINVLGNTVEVNQARIAADGINQGGRVRIGGDLQGGKASLAYQGMQSGPPVKQGGVYNAQNTTIRAGSSISASALRDGNGGTVIVWADKKTEFRGNIEAKGGAEGGKGGFAEVSGKDTLQFGNEGKVNLKGKDGNGTLLLDPRNITISADPNATVSTDGTPPEVTVGPTADDSNISIGTLQTLLATSSVIVDTGGAGSPGAQEGNIFLIDDFTYGGAGNNSLTLNAANDIFIGDAVNPDGNVIFGGTGAFSMVAGGDIFIRAGRSITMSDSGTLLGSAVGNFEMGAGASLAGNSISLSAASYSNAAGSTIMGTDEVVIGQSADLLLTQAKLDSFGISAAETTFGVLNGTLTLDNVNFGAAHGDVGLRQDGAGSIVVTGASSVTGDLEMETANGITLGAGLSATGDALVSAATVNSTAPSGYLSADALTLLLQNGGTFNTEVSELSFQSAGAGALNITNDGSLSVEGFATAGGAVSINTASPLDVNADMTAASIALTTADDGGAGADDLTVGAVTLTATTGNVALRSGDSLVLNAGSTIQTQAAGGGITLASRHNDVDGDGDVELGGSLIAGTGGIQVTSGNGAVNDAAGAVTTTGSLNITAGTGGIVLDNAANDFATVSVTSADSAVLRDVNALELGNVAVASVLDVGASGALTQTAATSLTGTGLRLAGTGSAVLENAGNNFTNFASQQGGNVSYRDANALTITTVTSAAGSTAGINSPGTTVILNNSGALTQAAAPITASELLLLGTGAVTLSNAANDVGTLAASRLGNISYTDSNALSIGTVAGVQGVDVGASNLFLSNDGILSQTEAISANGLRISGSGTATLTDEDNEINFLASDRAGSLSYRDASELTIGTVQGLAGIQMAGQTVALEAMGTLSQTQAITAANLLLSATGDSVLSLGNDVGVLASNRTGHLSFTDVNTLSIGAVNGVNGVTTGPGFDFILTASGGVTQTQAISARGLSVGSLGSVVLNNPANSVEFLEVNAASLVYVDSDGLTIGNVSGFSGITTTAGGVDITVRGDDSLLTLAEAINSATTVNLVADKMALGQTVTATGDVTLTQFQATDAVQLGSLTNATADTLELSNAELANIITPGVVTIGRADGGALSLVAPINVPGGSFADLVLLSNAAMTIGADLTVSNSVSLSSTSASITGAGRITTSSLDVSAATGIDLLTDVDFVAAAVTGPGNIVMANSGLTPVSLLGLQTADGDITFTSLGDILTGVIDAQGTGTVTLGAGGSIEDLLLGTDITALVANLTAGGSIGGLDTLETAVRDLNLIAGGSIDISNTSPQLNIVAQTGDGSIEITNTGSILADDIATGLTSPAANLDANDVRLESLTGDIVVEKIWTGVVDDPRSVDPFLIYTPFGTGGDLTLIALNGSITQTPNFTGTRSTIGANGVATPNTFNAIVGMEDNVIITDTLFVQAAGDVRLENDRVFNEAEAQRGNQINTLRLTSHTGPGTVFSVRDSRDGLIVDGDGPVTFDGRQTSITTRTGPTQVAALTTGNAALDAVWYNEESSPGAQRYNLVLRTPIHTTNGTTILASADGRDYVRIAGQASDDPLNPLPPMGAGIDATQVLTYDATGNWIIYTRDDLHPEYLFNIYDSLPPPNEVPAGGVGTTFDRDTILLGLASPLPIPGSRPTPDQSAIVYGFNFVPPPPEPFNPGEGGAEFPAFFAPEPLSEFLPVLDIFNFDVIDFTTLLLGIEGDESSIRLGSVDDEEQRKRAREKLERREQAQPVGLSIGPYTDSYYDAVAENFEITFELNQEPTNFQL